jgi:hypothetical protein
VASEQGRRYMTLNAATGSALSVVVALKLEQFRSGRIKAQEETRRQSSVRVASAFRA